MTENTDLAAQLAALAGVRVVVAGDVMLDRFLYGAVERISPEGPIPVLRIEREAAMLGGAGNVLRNLVALGAAVEFLAVVGDDAAGREVQALAREAAGAGCHLLVEAGRVTTIKERYIAAGQQLLRADRDPHGAIGAGTATALLAAATAALQGAGALVLSDYGKGVLEPETLAALIAAAQAVSCPVVVDPKGRDYGIYRGATLVTPNRRELEEATGLPTATDDEVLLAAQHVIDGCGVEGVVVTRGAQGMSVLRGGEGGHLRLPAAAREIFDVSGAGDTVVAMIAATLAADVDFVSAVKLANVAASIVVGKLGTATASRSELLQTLHASELMAAEAKVSDVEASVEQAARWRQKGLTIGFTNGCFDLLHPGHVSLLTQARAACDRLIVGLNSDASTRRLKGEGRPIQPEAARAAVLASLASVDLVVIFGEDTPLELIEALTPDVLVKGADYARDEVVGADLVERHGGKLILVELAPGHSTSDTIGRMPGGRMSG
ncbi:MAG: D-glycero-beta-D-manno-heptose 1-phosphate adenylyltransferase [Proteobacteria bacterium]|nr:D-glycero-beta-D-manno-heptose 1-phosphate adenylyltransferase [Pseudomonadota bacterium]